MYAKEWEGKIVDAVAKLREVGILIRDQLEFLREHIKCDWNIVTYCITPLRFKDSKYDWEKGKIHSLGHPNSSQMIYDLQQEIIETFSKNCLK